MVWVVDEVAARPEAAILVLVVVAAHLFAEGGLVHYQLLHPVSEKTALAVHAVPDLREAATQLQLPLRPRLGQALIAYLAHQTIIIIPCSVPIRTRAATHPPAALQALHLPEGVRLA
jgi:hypothetical protein